MFTCIALGLYTCFLKEHFSMLYSHLCYSVFLAIVLGLSIGLHSDMYLTLLGIAGYVALWASFVLHNLMIIKPTLK